MKFLATPKSVSDAVRPLMILNYVTGLRIFEYPRGTPRYVLTLIYILILVGLFGVTMQVGTQEFFESITLLKLEYVLYELMTTLNTLVVVYDMILGCFYSKKLNACYKKLAQIDETLQQLGSKFNYGELYLFIIVSIILWFLYIVITCIVALTSLPGRLDVVISIVTSQAYSVSVSFIVIFEFTIFVKCLQTRFELINELLSEGVAVSSTDGLKMGLFSMEDYAKIIDVKQRKHILSLKVLSQLNRQLRTRIRISLSGKRKFTRSRTQSRLPTQLQKQFQMELQGQSRNQAGDSNSTRRFATNAECEKRKHLLQTIRQVHLELCRVTKMLCTSFGIQIASEIGISIMFVTAALYNLYVRLIQEQENIAINTALDHAYVILIGTVYVAKVIIINRVCKNATTEGKRITEIIHAIYGCCVDVDIREEIQQFGLQIAHGPADISTFSISLNYQVIGTCLKTVTTYMVIIVQMSNSLEARKHVMYDD